MRMSSTFSLCIRETITINKCAIYFSQNISIRVILQDCVQKMLDLLNDAHFFRGTHIMARLWIIHVQLPPENQNLDLDEQIFRQLKKIKSHQGRTVFCAGAWHRRWPPTSTCSLLGACQYALNRIPDFNCPIFIPGYLIPVDAHF